MATINIERDEYIVRFDQLTHHRVKKLSCEKHNKINSKVVSYRTPSAINDPQFSMNGKKFNVETYRTLKYIGNKEPTGKKSNHITYEEQENFINQNIDDHEVSFDQCGRSVPDDIRLPIRVIL